MFFKKSHLAMSVRIACFFAIFFSNRLHCGHSQLLESPAIFSLVGNLGILSNEFKVGEKTDEVRLADDFAEYLRNTHFSRDISYGFCFSVERSFFKNLSTGFELGEEIISHKFFVMQFNAEAFLSSKIRFFGFGLRKFFFSTDERLALFFGFSIGFSSINSIIMSSDKDDLYSQYLIDLYDDFSPYFSFKIALSAFPAEKVGMNLGYKIFVFPAIVHNRKKFINTIDKSEVDIPSMPTLGYIDYGLEIGFVFAL